MAKVNNNIVTYGLSGLLGNQIVFRKDKAGRTIVATKPTFPANRTFNTGQLAHQDAFRMAIAYAKSAKDETVYINKAEGTPMNSYNAAVADWFNKPEVLEIDHSNWTGQAGQTIRVQAMDDTQVTEVSVVVFNGDNDMVEQGAAVRSDGLWWVYTTTAIVGNTSGARIVATAKDRPGNSTELMWQD